MPLALALALMAAAAPAAAVSAFQFSSGDPDGKIATASRPGPATGAAQETETADDFIVPAATTVSISQASFTGLVPSGTSMSISDVHVEIYRVFPLDSDVNRTSGPPTFGTTQVPTRANSPSDVALADVGSVAGTLTFSTTLLAANFTALNSIDLGIFPKPGQTTGGDGPVTGDEVRIDVTFTPPLVLTSDHYFFVPQVLLGTAGDHFLWLSAPKPIVAPGTPFLPDLQSWIRHAALDPDWLRVGTDIVGGGTFNAVFSLDGEILGSDGTACGTGAECVSRFCTDGVCCNTACDGLAEQCDLAGQSGTCVSLAAPAPALTLDGLCVGSALLVGIAAIAWRRRSPD
ncbi:MAG TPA: PEP-CTERM sorting domain-containing protein [Candidatus Dormibacteraeota bacterium]|nr:PEP-CTERM sorting domain-containing protein [Candidatus Dormibacteraeota bacterium]